MTFSRDEDAKNAISKMNGASLEGKNITVNEAKEKGSREGSHGGGRNRY